MNHTLEDLIEAVGLDIDKLTHKANKIEEECYKNELKPSERIELYKKRFNKTELAFSLFIIEESIRVYRRTENQENINKSYM